MIASPRSLTVPPWSPWVKVFFHGDCRNGSRPRRIITDLYEKKASLVKRRQDQNTTLAGFPARQVAFTYSDGKQGPIVEHPIISLGRNERRGIRMKVPLPDEERFMSMIKKMLETYQPGRDQKAVSPLAPKEKR